MAVAYVAVSFAQRHELSAALDMIEHVLKQHDLRPHTFVRCYQFADDQAHEMMQTALRDLEQADMLIAEVTYKAIGVGVEVGYAHALGKPILYLHHADAEYSKTIGGLADVVICYRDLPDLAAQLGAALDVYGTNS
ncbi:MAG: nucleoside 2-deoxyribosyltransferase [Anaerolineae bacterium]|nr:nucleoside 2-deoxyribosyltransferase [Anaerolineae bacterium]